MTSESDRDRKSWIEPLAIERLESVQRDLKGWSEKSISFDFDTNNTHLFSMFELAYSYPKRCVDFASTIQSLLLEERLAPAVVVARSLIETNAMACLYTHDMMRLIRAQDSDRLKDRLSRFYAGVKGGSIQPIHVMDAIRHLEQIDRKYIDYLDKKHGVLSQAFNRMTIMKWDSTPANVRETLSVIANYGMLCEISHPNGTGTQFIYPDKINESGPVTEMRERCRFWSLMAIWQCHHLLRALDQWVDLPQQYRSAFMGAA